MADGRAAEFFRAGVKTVRRRFRGVHRRLETAQGAASGAVGNPRTGRAARALRCAAARAAVDDVPDWHTGRLYLRAAEGERPMRFHGICVGAIAALAIAATSASARDRALVVGVNKYPELIRDKKSGGANLAGPVADVQTFASLLVDIFKF